MQKDVGKFGISDKRGRVKTSSDPYIPEEGRKEPSLCSGCKAVYKNKRWTFDPDFYETASKDSGSHWVTCPACQKIEQKYAEGVVTLRGSYLWEHEEEIRNILKNEETRAMAKNPLERIIQISRQDDALVVETTEEKLAEHLGRALHKAHQGEINVSWTEDHARCRVTWEREG
ncbi:MAG: BCAM0308 family protein [Desulfuromonadales bacterium]|nr:BCAM0308 family protein [Desulfuromonadales bacterium]MDW7757434.1 BCAM0308 family protein [Desulfuromonadales bacterium]